MSFVPPFSKRLLAFFKVQIVLLLLLLYYGFGRLACDPKLAQRRKQL